MCTSTWTLIYLDTKFLSNVLVFLPHIYFDQKTGENPESFKNLKLFYFFIDYSMIDAKAAFEK